MIKHELFFNIKRADSFKKYKWDIMIAGCNPP